MNAYLSLFSGEFCRNLVTALGHTLWQGLFVAGIVYAYLRCVPAEAANKRYIISLVGLIAIVLCGLLTWSVLNYEPAVTESAAAGDVANVQSSESTALLVDTKNDATSGQRKEIITDKGQLEASIDWQTWATWIWAIGVVAMLLRAVSLILGGNRLRKKCAPLEDAEILSLVEQLRQKMGISRHIRVVVGKHISIPGVVGCFWPTLLLPASIVSGVPLDDLKAMLTHELAHIRRFDYLVNFGQMIIEALLFFNPAVWWVSRQVRIEREACCDAAGITVTGQRIMYAEMLVAWAQKMREGRSTAAAAIVGFANEEDGKVLDRVKRIMVAGHRPRLRVSWPVAAVMVLLSVICVIGLWRGTDIAVTFAGNIISPQERIEKINEISQDYGYVDREYGDDEKIQVSGTVRTYDGGPFGKHPSVWVNSQRPRYGGSATVSVSTKDQPQGVGTFQYKANYGQIYIIATSEGYAPAFAGSFDPKPGDNIEGIELVLPEGFPGRIQLQDEAGQPIVGAKLVGGYVYPNDGSYHHTLKMTTDENGIATQEHAAEHTIGLNIAADGFEPEQIKDIMFRPDEITALTLKAAKPATGIVVSEQTGEPIEGAEVRLMMSRMGNHSYGESGDYGDPETFTGSQGRFVLSKLRADREYLILFKADGYGYKYVTDIKAGDSDVEVALGPRQIICGTVTGSLERLSKDKDGNPFVSYCNYYKLGNSGSEDSSKKCPVIIEDGVGYFEIDDFYGQQVKVTAGGKRISVDVENDDLENVVIDLQPLSELMREVVLVFNTPEGSPVMQGGVRFDYVQEGQRGYKPGWVDVNDGVAYCQVKVPCRFKYSIDYYHGKRPVGYWFKESKDIDIPVGEELYEIQVPVHPAGAIYGRILNHDGGLVTNVSASLLVVKKPEVAREGLNGFCNALLGGGVDKGKFNATPLPLGGEYAIVAYDGYNFVLTNTFELDDKNQLIEHDIYMPEGITMSGRLVDIDGNPVRDMVRMRVSVKRGQANWSTETSDIRPDANGDFSFENVNPDFDGKYFVYANVRHGYRPVRYEVNDLTKPFVIQLERGKLLKGVVIEDATGKPVPGAQVYAYRHEKDGESYEFENLEAEGSTNGRGEFVFSNMAAKEYQLGVRLENLAYSMHTVKGIGGQKEPVTLKVKIPQWSKMKSVGP